MFSLNHLQWTQIHGLKVLSWANVEGGRALRNPDCIDKVSCMLQASYYMYSMYVSTLVSGSEMQVHPQASIQSGAGGFQRHLRRKKGSQSILDPVSQKLRGQQKLLSFLVIIISLFAFSLREAALEVDEKHGEARLCCR